KGSKAQARQKLDTLRDQVRSGRLSADNHDTTVRDLMARWLAALPPDLELTTKQRYAMQVNKHVIPHLGDRLVRELEAQDVREWLGRLGEQGLSARYIGECKTRLSSALRLAQELRLTHQNVASIVKA